MKKVGQLLKAIKEDNDMEFEIITEDINVVVQEVKDMESELERLKMELVSANIKYTDAVENKANLVSEIVSLQERVNSIKEPEDNSEYEEQIIRLNNKIEMLTSELNRERERPDYSEDIIIMTAEIENLERQLKEQSESNSTMIAEKYNNQIETVKQNNDKLQGIIATKNIELSKLTQEITKLKSKLDIKGESREDLEQVIKKLRFKLNETSSCSEIQQYPIIDQHMSLKADSLIVFKEIKNCIYMNSMLDYVASHFCVNNNTEARLEQGLKFLLVLDPLNDETTKLKYRKHKFPINENFTDIGCRLPMLITNKPQKDIESLIDLSIYKKIVIVDRYRRLESAVKRKGVDTYYSIDSPTDPSDYNLNTSKCVAYYKDGRTNENTKPCIYFVDPSFSWDDRLDPEEGCTCMMASIPFVAQVLCDDYSTN